MGCDNVRRRRQNPRSEQRQATITTGGSNRLRKALRHDVERQQIPEAMEREKITHYHAEARWTEPGNIIKSQLSRNQTKQKWNRTTL